ncbi:hypothetical protein [Deinococcus humi]|uniref:Uncharacterized protein n=1 Tax=Deinococcus humi TaxID=662880 RepID=A0A7W8K2H2_9DEIO|nr:hypothetical protein [Deinococcus humi]MBB5366363.1 hypothetical protein [Deinococcus humi]GGO41459.1 hypothetical protein GCM10008949_52310 [Deinococcus humi]
MSDPHPDRLERLIMTAARHLPHRADTREREWLSLYDECTTRAEQVQLTATCLLLASGGLLRGGALKLARGFLLLTLLAIPGNFGKLLMDAGPALALGIVILMLLPSLQRRSFDAPWYPALTWPAWIWRVSAAAWVLLLLSGALVSHDLLLTLVLTGVMLLLYGEDLNQVTGRRTAR